MTPREARVGHTLRYLTRVYRAGDTVEIRGLQPPMSCTTADFALAAEWGQRRSEAGSNVYRTLHPVTPGRGQAATTSGMHVVRINNLMVDIDVKSGKGFARKDECTTAEEKLACLPVMAEVRARLEERFGWPLPVVVDSGSCYQIIYCCQGLALETEKWKRLLYWLASECDTDLIEIDTSVHDLPRVARLPGTGNQRGRNTVQRPYRWAKVIDWAEGAGFVTQALLDAAVPTLPVPSAPPWQEYEAEGDATEVDVWALQALYPAHIKIEKRRRDEGAQKTIFYLSICPWFGDRHRTQRFTCLVLRDNGVLGFTCLSKSCRCNIEDLHFRNLLFWLAHQTGRKHRLLEQGGIDPADLDSERWGGTAPAPPIATLEPSAASVDQVVRSIIDTVTITVAPVAAKLERRLHVDFESLSELGLKDHGLDRYWAHPSTKLLLCGFAFDEEPVQVVDFTADETLPVEVLEALTSPAVEKLAWNVPFEVCGIEARLGLTMDFTQWNDPMTLSRYLGFPGKLEDAAIALQLPQRKDKRGTELIAMFSKQQKAKAKQIKDGAPALYWRDRTTDPEAWAEFKHYCGSDVEVERAVMLAMESRATLPALERTLWVFDQMVNFGGWPLDMTYVKEAKILIDAADDMSRDQLKKMTGTSITQTRPSR